jgi:type IV pilus assembly protein PilA
MKCTSRFSSPFIPGPSGGFTLIELMIVIATIAVILALALPVYSNYIIRAKVTEALGIATSAKTSVAATCVEDPTIVSLTPALAGYAFSSSKYVESIDISGPCTNPVITIKTQLTGAASDPVLTLTGNFPSSSSSISWTCTTNGSNTYVPETCRS